MEKKNVSWGGSLPIDRIVYNLPCIYGCWSRTKRSLGHSATRKTVRDLSRYLHLCMRSPCMWLREYARRRHILKSVMSCVNYYYHHFPSPNALSSTYVSASESGVQARVVHGYCTSVNCIFPVRTCGRLAVIVSSIEVSTRPSDGRGRVVPRWFVRARPTSGPVRDRHFPT